MQLQPGDRVLFHTDGLLEAGASAGHPIRFGSLRRFLLERAQFAPEALSEALYGFGLSVAGESGYHDDVTMILVAITDA